MAELQCPLCTLVLQALLCKLPHHAVADALHPVCLPCSWRSWPLALPGGFFYRCGGLATVAAGPAQVLSATLVWAAGSWLVSWLLLRFPWFRKPHCAPRWSAPPLIVRPPELLGLARHFCVLMTFLSDDIQDICMFAERVKWRLNGIQNN